MTLEKDILKVVPGLQATALVGYNVNALKGMGKKKFGVKKITKLGVGNLVGISLLKPTAEMINKIQ